MIDQDLAFGPAPAKKAIRKNTTREDLEKTGYDNIFEAIVIASKWARELNIERKRKKETGKILEEFELEEFAAPKPENAVAKDEELKVTMQAMQDVAEGKVVVDKKPKEELDDFFRR
jgi:DNA-directed RNA polymerase subunit K/omega